MQAKKLPSLRFKPAADLAFRKQLKLEADAYLLAQGQDRFGDYLVFLKAIGLAAAMGTAYAYVLTAQSSAQFIPAYVGFIILAMTLAMNSLHDAAHGAVFKAGYLNRLLMRITSIPVGIDPTYWTIRHVHFHHTYANIEGYDLDTEPNAFLRQTPFQDWHPQYRYQHLYWPIVAALSLPYLCWYSDWADRFGLTKVAGHGKLGGAGAWLTFLLTKAAHVSLVLLLPMWALQGAGIGWGQVLGWYVLGQMIASCFLVALILGTHWAEVQFFQPGADGTMPHTWYEHTFYTACDWLPRPAWIGYWLGGLNYHLTHHLFPTTSHRHYPELAKIVQRVARQHDLLYRELNYQQLMASQQKFLKAMGQPVVQT